MGRSSFESISLNRKYSNQNEQRSYQHHSLPLPVCTGQQTPSQSWNFFPSPLQPHETCLYCPHTSWIRSGDFACFSAIGPDSKSSFDIKDSSNYSIVRAIVLALILILMLEKVSHQYIVCQARRAGWDIFEGAPFQTAFSFALNYSTFPPRKSGL